MLLVWELVVLCAVKLDLIDFQLRRIHLSSFCGGILNVMSYKWALTKNIVSNIVIKVCFSVLKCWTWHSKCSVVTNVCCPVLCSWINIPLLINLRIAGHNFWHLNLIKALSPLVPELPSDWSRGITWLKYWPLIGHLTETASIQIWG